MIPIAGCACDPAIIENNSEAPVEVAVWSRANFLARLEAFRGDLAPGERWRASCSDRVDIDQIPDRKADLRVYTRDPAGGIGRSWLIDVEQKPPLRIRILGSPDGLRFQSLREDGVVRAPSYLKAREEVWWSGAE